MDSSGWQRLGGIAGIGFVVVQLLSQIFAPQEKNIGATAAKIASNPGPARLSAYLSGLAVVLFVWFVGTMGAYLRGVEGEPATLSGIALAGGLLTAGAAMVGTILAAASVHFAADLRVPVASALAAATGTSFVFGTFFGLAVLAAAVGMVTMKRGGFPKWFGSISPLFTLVFLAWPAVAIYSKVDAEPPAIGLIFLIIWMLITSMLLIQRSGRPASA